MLSKYILQSLQQKQRIPSKAELTFAMIPITSLKMLILKTKLKLMLCARVLCEMAMNPRYLDRGNNVQSILNELSGPKLQTPGYLLSPRPETNVMLASPQEPSRTTSARRGYGPRNVDIVPRSRL